jgi:hypothetical protein
VTDIAWQANTPYLAGAVVTETSGLPLWRAIVAGTSGGSEPTWPAAAPWTVVDGGTLTWALNTTFREDVRNGIMTTLGLFKIANPTLVRKLWRVRPESFTLGDLPALTVGDVTESIATANGVRQRQMDGFTVEITDSVSDNLESSNRGDLLVDAIMDFLTANYHMASGTSIVEPIGVTDGSTGVTTEAPNLTWYSQVITFRAYIMEGRT